MIAFIRTADVLLTAFPKADIALFPLGDGIYAWPTPEGRPDSDSQWLSGMANLYSWNFISVLLEQDSFHTRLAAGMPDAAKRLGHRPGGILGADQMVGYALRPAAMTTLVADVDSPTGALAALNGSDGAKKETALRRLVALIARLARIRRMR